MPTNEHEVSNGSLVISTKHYRILGFDKYTVMAPNGAIEFLTSDKHELRIWLDLNCIAFKFSHITFMQDPPGGWAVFYLENKEI